MRRKAFFATLSCVALFVAGQARSQTHETTAEIAKFEADFSSALSRNDVAELERYLSTDWKIVSGDGDTIDKKRFLKVVASGDLKHTKMTSENQTIRRYGNMALVTARTKSTGSYKNVPFETEEIGTDFIVKIHGHWVCVQTQLTTIAKRGAPAVAASQYGRVEFANSGASTAQADFRDGLALLHDFEYDSAAAAFRRAESADPDFAMAYWGEAMTFNHPVWMQQDLNAARAALNRLAPSSAARRSKAQTEREKAYLDAIEILYGDGTKEDRDVRYEDAMAKVLAHYPDDVDAAAFYGLSILGSAHGGRDLATYMRSAAVLEEAWTSHREHPGLVHYLIHSYDDPAHARLGLRAARIYAKIAPDAGHAQHMTSHIFLALGMWAATVDANVAAIAAVNRTRLAAGKKPVGCGHYSSWLGYAYLQLGNVESARSTLAACRATMEGALAMEHPAHSMDPDDSMTASFANMRLRYLLETGEWNGEVAQWTVPTNAGPSALLDFAFARALGEITQGNLVAAREAIGKLETLAHFVVDLEAKRGDPDPTDRVRPEILLEEARGLMAEQENHLATADKLLRRAVALEMTLPIAFGPPTIDQPTHELLGAFLLRHGQRIEARTEFEKAVAAAPGRRLAENGLRAVSIGH